jgi:hypothetical protein
MFQHAFPRTVTTPPEKTGTIVTKVTSHPIEIIDNIVIIGKRFRGMFPRYRPDSTEAIACKLTAVLVDKFADTFCKCPDILTPTPHSGGPVPIVRKPRIGMFGKFVTDKTLTGKIDIAGRKG